MAQPLLRRRVRREGQRPHQLALQMGAEHLHACATASCRAAGPDEESVTLVQADPTWAVEYEHFKRLCETGVNNIGNDIWINDTLRGLGRLAQSAASRMLMHLHHARPRSRARVVVLGAGGFIGGAILRAAAADGIATVAIGAPGTGSARRRGCEASRRGARSEDVLVFASAKAPCRDLQMLRENLVMAEAVCSALKATPGCACRLHQLRRRLQGLDGAADRSVLRRARFPARRHAPRARSRAATGIRRTARHSCVRRSSTALDDPHNGYGPNRFRRLAAAGKDIVLFGEGEERRDHVDVEDVAELVRLIIVHRSAGIANAVSGAVVSFRELAEFVASEFAPRVAGQGQPRATDRCRTTAIGRSTTRRGARGVSRLPLQRRGATGLAARACAASSRNASRVTKCPVGSASPG